MSSESNEASTPSSTTTAATTPLGALRNLRFRPHLIDDLKGYNPQRFLADLSSGITVGIVALPLAMAFAIASGVKPEAGLITAIVAGLLISLLGGSLEMIASWSGNAAALGIVT